MTHVGRARSLLGVPWAHQGRDPSIALDCIGLVVLAFEVPASLDIVDYPRNPVHRANLLDDALEAYFGPPVDDVPRVGDVVTIGFSRRLLPRHVAIIGDGFEGGLSLIHTDSKVGRVVEHPIDSRWHRRICNVYRAGGEP